VVCDGGCGKAPTHMSHLGDPGSGMVLRLVGVHGATAVLHRGTRHGSGSFGVVWWAPLLTSTNAWLGFGRSTIVCA
jgi:hypothetical protein